MTKRDKEKVLLVGVAAIGAYLLFFRKQETEVLIPGGGGGEVIDYEGAPPVIVPPPVDEIKIPPGTVVTDIPTGPVKTGDPHRDYLIAVANNDTGQVASLKLMSSADLENWYRYITEYWAAKRKFHAFDDWHLYAAVDDILEKYPTMQYYSAYISK